MRFTPIFILLCLAAGCSRSTDASTAGPSDSPAINTLSDNPQSSMEIRIQPMMAVPRHSVMHLTASAGNIFFVAENDDNRDVVMRITDLDTAQPTSLTYASVAAAIGFPSAGGNFQGLAGWGDSLYFYCTCTFGQTFHAALGRYFPATQKMEIIAREQQLAALGGAQLSISRGEMICSGNILWLWFHSVDGAHFLQLHPDSPDPAMTLCRPFDHLTSDFARPDLAHEGYLPGAALNGSLLINDPALATVWEISPAGQTYARKSLVALPVNASAPVVDVDDRLVLFFPASDRASAQFEWQTPHEIPITHFPAFLIFGRQETQSVFGQSLRSPSQFPPEKLLITSLCPAPHGEGWIGYDPNFGELFAVKAVKR